MLNWNDTEKARLHREDLLREASAERRAPEDDRPRRSNSWFLAGIAAARRWLHELGGVLPRETLSQRLPR